MTTNKNSNHKLTEKITALFLALVLTACSVTPVSTPSPGAPPATAAIPTPTEIPIRLEGEVFSTTENLPEEIIPSMELFTEMSEGDGLDINELDPILWIKAARGEMSVNFTLLQVAVVSDLTDPDSEPGNPKPVYYIAYRDEQGQMQGGYVLGKLIEKDSQGASYVARMLSEETFRNWQNNTQPEDGSYTVGQVVYSVPLREDISVEQARTMQAKLNSGELSSKDFMENYTEEVAFIQPGQEKQVVGIDKDKSAPELMAKPFWQELFSGVTEAQAAVLEFYSEPEPTPTVEPTEITLTPEQQLTEYLQTAEAKESIDQFVNAMKMAGIEISAEQVNQCLAIEELKDTNRNPFLIATYDLDPNPNQAGEIPESPIPLLIAEKNENGEWEWRTSEWKDSQFFYKDINIGTSIDGYDMRDFKSDPFYQRNIVKRFNAIDPSMNYNLISQDKSVDLESLMLFADKNNLVYYVGGGFWHLDVDQIKNLNSAELKSFIENYPGNFFQYISPKNNNEPPTIVHFFNEPVWEDSGNLGWLESPYFKAYGYNGVDMLSQCYLSYYRAAEKKGLILGKDYRLTIGLDGVFTPNKKAYFIHDSLIQVKKRIANELSISVEQVNLDIAMQIRVDVHYPYNNEDGFYPPARSSDEIKMALELFSDIGPIHIVEFETNGEINDKKRTELIIDYTEKILSFASENPGKLKSIFYFATMRTPNSEISQPPPDFFKNTKNYIPLYYYYLNLSKLLGIK
jgi:hypothetical protein